MLAIAATRFLLCCRRRHRWQASSYKMSVRFDIFKNAQICRSRLAGDCDDSVSVVLQETPSLASQLLQTQHYFALTPSKVTYSSTASDDGPRSFCLPKSERLMLVVPSKPAR